MKKIFVFLSTFGMFLGLTIMVNAQKINCDVDPYLPDPSWKVLSHEKCGTINFSTLNLKLVKLDKITNKEEFSKVGLNACVLDYLLEHQELIPVDWRNKEIVFTGTVYLDPSGEKLYRNLSFWDGTWNWSRTYWSDILDGNYRIVKI